eukprot:gnl/TRDRNA2_/TRDRNA2_85382_c0_seq2.p1 gnl/TRDRNA2_/TRDRNA2_85382_c0~~gnl/TRDRNA2_/TRDRNA2_85382_c0_seq2.p1  ORF type:complete len:353 (-),score=53.00 gnl/TRDRNA2_/TRDRNA2_85382_c0_seq2:85-1143(-)
MALATSYASSNDFLRDAVVEGSAVGPQEPARSFGQLSTTKLNRSQSRSLSAARTVGDGIPAMQAALQQGGPLRGTWLRPPILATLDGHENDMDRRLCPRRIKPTIPSLSPRRKAMFDKDPLTSPYRLKGSVGAMSQKMKGRPACGPHIAAPTAVRGRQGYSILDDIAMKAPVQARSTRPSSAPCGQASAQNSVVGVASVLARSGVGRDVLEAGTAGSAVNSLRGLPSAPAPVAMQAAPELPQKKDIGDEGGSSVASAARPTTRRGPQEEKKAKASGAAAAALPAEAIKVLSADEAAALLKRVAAAEKRLQYLEGKIKANGITMSIVSSLPPSEVERRKPPSSTQRSRSQAAP